mmetsp:Transcript_8706/g.15686  ORF Transcript_8706/g.15686 Transcript_8706/m.15686 type:complete len:497 (+) Transcript_8706:90-1580(+)
MAAAIDMGLPAPSLPQDSSYDPQQAMLATTMGGIPAVPDMGQTLQSFQAYFQAFQHYLQQSSMPGPPAGVSHLAMPPAPVLPPQGYAPQNATVSVSVQGMRFQYQLTEEDLQKVFSRYGKVVKILVDESGGAAQITFSSYHEAQTVISDLDGKALNGLSGTLRIQWVQDNSSLVSACSPLTSSTTAACGSLPGAVTPQAATYSGWMPPQSTTAGLSTSWGTTSILAPPVLDSAAQEPSQPAGTDALNDDSVLSALGGSAGKGVRKYTCRFIIGIENDQEFQVARRIIGAKGSNMKKIVRTTDAKLRLRGQGSGYFEGAGQKESPEPLQLCVSCTSADGYWSALSQVQDLLTNVYDDYKQFCSDRGLPVPELAINLSENQVLHSSAGRAEVVGGNDSWGDNCATPPKEARARRSAKAGSKFSKLTGDVEKGTPGPNAPAVDVIEQLIDKRNEARRSCNFAEADRIREELHNCGIALMDEPGGRGKGAEVTTWRYWRD